MTTLTKNQKLKRTKVYTENGQKYRATAQIQHDDECGNGHNTFSITCDVYRIAKNGRIILDSCGCQHDLVSRLWPDLKPYIKWHLCSTDGPMHYIQNTIYHASDRDYWGLKKGEPRHYNWRVRFGANPITRHGVPSELVKWLHDCGPGHGTPWDYEIIRYDHDDRETFSPKYTFGGYAEKWHQCPFDSEEDAANFLAALQNCKPQFLKVPVSWGTGKEPDLEAARHTAIWPDATLEQLQDRETLEARLPTLLAEFRRDVESLGLIY
jgi:hypothetical protein